MDLNDLRRLFEYNEWANRRALDAASRLTPEQFVRPMGSSYSSVRDTLVHLFGVEWVWLERLRGTSPPALPAADDYPDAHAVRTRWQSAGDDLLRSVRALTKSDLERQITYTNFRGQPFTYSLPDMFLHLALHGAYHRGQVATLLRQLGATPRSTDFLLHQDALGGLPVD